LINHLKEFPKFPPNFCLSEICSNQSFKQYIIRKEEYLLENLLWGTSSDNNRGKKMRRPDTMEQKYANLVAKDVIKG
jgi:hypothetical protein